jgi:hypothetical protein
MTIEAQVIADSVGPNGVRLTTMTLMYPRMIHAEYMTHRAFSRNASSSRAIPVKKLINMAVEDPAFFSEVRLNEPGMQGQVLADPETLTKFHDEWLQLMRLSAEFAKRWAAPVSEGGYNIHKQHVNRVMEPWHHIKVVHTATEWDNFFRLRRHPAAEPTMAAVAEAMYVAREASTPAIMVPGEWHLPFIRMLDRVDHDLDELIKISTARCARVSYMRHDGTPAPVSEDLQLHARLVERDAGSDDPVHMSPAEHQAQCLPKLGTAEKWSGNLRGWHQYRKTLEVSREFFQRVPASP